MPTVKQLPAQLVTVPQTFSIAGNLILPATTGLVIDVTAFG